MSTKVPNVERIKHFNHSSLGYHDVDSDKFPLLVSGYLREAEEENDLIIPMDIKKETSDYFIKYKIYAMGGNFSGQFGLGHKVYGNYLDKNGNPTNKYLWQRLVELENLCCNLNALFIEHESFKTITDLGQIYVTGNNTAARLGASMWNASADTSWTINSSHLICNFTKMTSFEDKLELDSYPIILSIGCKRSEHSFIYTNNHDLYASGNNVHGVFGTGDKAIYKTTILHQKISTNFIQHKFDYLVDIRCGAKHTVFLTTFGNVYCCGKSEYGQAGKNGGKVLLPALIPLDHKAVKIRCGDNHTLIVDEMQQLHGFGANEDGALGFENQDGMAYYHNPMTNPYFEANNIAISDVVCGPKHTLCTDIDGNCYRFGAMQNGQKTIFYSRKPVKLDLFGDDKTCHEEYAVHIATGTAHFGILSSLNRLVCIGSNNHSQCSVLIAKRTIYDPYVVSKSYDIGINENDFIEKIFCESNNTVIILNPNKTATIIQPLLDQRMHDFNAKLCRYNMHNLVTFGSELEMRWVAEFGDEFVENDHGNGRNGDIEVIESSDKVGFGSYPGTNTELWTFQNAFDWARQSIQFSFDNNVCGDQNIVDTVCDESQETMGAFTFDVDLESFSWDKGANKTDLGKVMKFSWNF